MRVNRRRALYRGAYTLATVSAALAFAPLDQRSPETIAVQSRDTLLDRRDLLLLRQAFNEAQAQPISRSAIFAP